MKFYNSRKWRRFRAAYVVKVYGICETKGCIRAGKELHHHEPLNDYNLDDPNISLNEDKVSLYCTECHNEQRATSYIRQGLEFDSNGNLIEKQSGDKQ